MPDCPQCSARKKHVLNIMFSAHGIKVFQHGKKQLLMLTERICGLRKILHFAPLIYVF